MNNECFISTLAKLKSSSLEAVESSKSLSDFKKYMHINRAVQKEFEQYLFTIQDNDTAELILLCGSVGDGKSHILSYYNENYPEVMAKYTIHNDSTASFYKNKPAIESLREVLENFTDEKIDNTHEKLILAINLGTLNNFIEADLENRFQRLKDYVEKSKILEEVRSVNHEEKIPHFQFVNFSDYHLYSLTNEGPKSFYLQELIKRITARSDENIFDKKYKEICMECPSKKICPVKANFELLRKDSFRNAIINVVIAAVIKEKLIISTRALYNFVYELLIDSRHINSGSAEPKNEISKLDEMQYCESLIINNFFTQSDSSELFAAIKELDPLWIRKENLDTFIVDFYNKENVIKLFNDELPEIQHYMKKVEEIDVNEHNRRELKDLLLKSFVRAYYLLDKNELFELRDEAYDEYVEYLYYWNKGVKTKLKDLYSLVKEGTLHWNGDTEDSRINVYIGQAQTDYTISQFVDIKQDLSNIVSNPEEELQTFLNTLKLEYKNSKTEESYRVEIDFNLYRLLSKIVNGYRPNLKDKKLNIKFNDFVEAIVKSGSKDEILIITQKNRIVNKSYKLEYSEDFGYTFEVV